MVSVHSRVACILCPEAGSCSQSHCSDLQASPAWIWECKVNSAKKTPGSNSERLTDVFLTHQGPWGGAPNDSRTGGVGSMWQFWHVLALLAWKDVCWKANVDGNFWETNHVHSWSFYVSPICSACCFCGFLVFTNFPQKGRPLSSYLISSHFSHHQFPIGFVQDEAILEDPSRSAPESLCALIV